MRKVLLSRLPSTFSQAERCLSSGITAGASTCCAGLQFLRPNSSVDSNHPAVQQFALRVAGTAQDQQEASVRLFYEIRDGWRYNPYCAVFSRDAFRASNVVLRQDPRTGHCIDKALLLAASARVLGIPSRLHFANVKNHIGVERLVQLLGTDLLVFHGYTELYINNRWVRATPAFNAELCHRLGVDPLEFDGRQDCMFQEYDGQGRNFMVYVKDHGSYPEVPYDTMMAELKKHYPLWAGQGKWPGPADSVLPQPR